MQVDFIIFNQSSFYHVVQDVLLFPNIFLFLVEGLCFKNGLLKMFSTSIMKNVSVRSCVVHNVGKEI